ncbi:MAG: ImmA/IrrE family metallo-endopeptidase [Sphingobacteriales bacterium]|nr:MAG: ImmA/IrrE family metallo-endopeptidase [Sphingobacteriales bacterium]
MQRQQVKPNTIEIARLSRGKVQLELSEEVGIKQGTLSKIESGLIIPNEDIIEKIAKSLNYPVAFFYEDIVIPPTFAIHYRKKKALDGLELQKLQYKIYILKHFVKKLTKAVNIKNNMFYLNPDEHGDPEEIATQIRLKWSIPRGPIKNLMSIVEAAGVIVLLVDYENDEIDGEVVPDENGMPFIYLNKNRPPDRIRFTLAHELGHLIMHTKDYIVSGVQAEDEANLFAGAFLAPSDDIRYQLDDNLSLARLADLKRHWKMSMASLVKAAERVGVESKKTKSLWVQLSKSGYRKKEPDLGIPYEHPTLVKQIFDIYFDSLGYSIDDLASLVPLYKTEIRGIIDLYSNKTIRLMA